MSYVGVRLFTPHGALSEKIYTYFVPKPLDSAVEYNSVVVVEGRDREMFALGQVVDAHELPVKDAKIVIANVGPVSTMIGRVDNYHTKMLKDLIDERVASLSTTELIKLKDMMGW